MEFKPDKYQTEIFKFVIDLEINHNGRHLVVKADAGTGKTTTIEHATKLISPKKSIAFVAYNNHIVDAYEPRKTANTKVMTCHKLGYIAVIRRMKIDGRNPEMDAYKVHNMVKVMLDAEYMELGEEASRSMRSIVPRIVSLLKNTLLPVNKESIEFLIEEHHIDNEVDHDILTQICAKIMLKCAQVFGKTDTCCIDFDDQLWLPIIHKLPLMQFDYVFGDEIQDWNNVQLELILKAIKPNGSIIAVGDPNQSMYGFRGADESAVEHMIERLNAKVLPLSICYRCPTSHVALAQKYVSSIEPSPYKGAGIIRNIKMDELYKNIQKGDLVLCRNNAHLVKPCFQLIRNGINATIRGKDIGEGLITKIRKTKGTKMTEFLPNLKKDIQKEKANLESIGKSVESLMDRYETLLVLAEDCEDTNCLIQKINTIFSDKDSTVVFSTVHKAKGLEANSVYILLPSLMPSPYAKTDKQLKQENNIIYVSLTRAKEILTFIN
jgi:DNA helicase-2/ATP-dependent DNA helicase PcrA